jgi:hypothetical protein
MSHSVRTATSRIGCRGVCVKRLTNVDESVLDTSTATPVRWLLRSTFEKKSVEQQQDHGADDRHDPAGGIILAREDATDPCSYQCTGDTEQNRDDATTRISARHQQLCDRADNETDKDGPND